jgi:hypothetical protein
MSNGTTALMPLDPALSPRQVTRVLPIRANLLPGEITAGRTARRTRGVLIGAVGLVILVMGGWFLFADKQRDLVGQDLASTTQQVDTVRAETRKDAYAKVTDTKKDRVAIDGELKSALKNDLPWATLLDSVRSTATRKSVGITTIIANLDDPKVAAGAKAAGSDVGTLSISGTAKDKKTIAGYVDALAGVHAVSDAYLTAANQVKPGSWTFTLTADITDEALCGRFTTPCKTGGK